MKRLLLAFAFVGCQSYQFEPVTPHTLVVSTEIDLPPVLKPNVMIAVDRSGSMAAKVVSLDPTCQSCAPGACPAACPTRISELKQAVSTFTTLADDRVRLGLTVFPDDPPATLIGAEAACLPATTVRVPLPAPSRLDDAQASAANRAAATQVNSAVQALTPNGGTPTGATLAFLSTRAELTAIDSRNDFVLLLTDGLPNCNANNPNDFVQSAAACRCQTGGGDCSALDVRRRGCLDADATVQSVEHLATLGVRTIVVGFGADVSQTDARDVLERLARAGGVARTCTQNAQCGAGDQCTNGLCGRWAFEASNRAELEAVLATVLDGLTPARCVRQLPDQPVSQNTISLLADGSLVAPGPTTWELVSPREIRLAPDFCDRTQGLRLTVQVAAVK